MKSILLAFGALFILLPFLSFAKKDHNYKYVYHSSCKCIVAKDNPNGIQQVTIASYETDPDVHTIVGFYHATVKTDSISLVDFSPKSFSYYPFPFPFDKDKKYVFLFPGKPDMDQVELLFTKEENGEIKELKHKNK